MNTIRNIEGATIASIGALCVAAIFSLAMQSAQAVVASRHAAAANANVQTVTIVAKRMSAEEKAQVRAELNAGHVL